MPYFGKPTESVNTGKKPMDDPCRWFYARWGDKYIIFKTEPDTDEAVAYASAATNWQADELCYQLNGSE